jgi:hypothetical protein
VQFDWTHILKPTPQTLPPDAPRERVAEAVEKRARRVERRAVPRPGDGRSRPPMTDRVPKPAREDPDVQQPAKLSEEAEPSESDTGPLDLAEETLAEPAVSGDDEPAAEVSTEDRTSAAYQRLGSEGLARLRARYAEVMARTSERPMDDAAREELKLRAERLNPDGWVTRDEVQQALEQYESVVEGFRALVGTHRRRRRRRGQGANRKTE